MSGKFPFFKQLDAMDCGPTCIRMIAKFYGRNYSLQLLRQESHIDKEGVSVRGMVEAAEFIGLRSLVVRLPLKANETMGLGLLEAPKPCIIHWQHRHFVVVYKTNNKYIWIADPEVGKVKLSHQEVAQNWLAKDGLGVVVLLETSPDFFQREGETLDKTGFGFLVRYIWPYRTLLNRLVLGIVLAAGLQFLFPFLTQAIVDIGIQNQDIGFVNLILLAQLMIFVGQISIQFIQNWIILHIGSRMNISLISDFLIKLMRLSLEFFDAKMTGDLLQRIMDHRRIEALLKYTSLTILLSIFTMVVFGVVLFIYNPLIFTVFLVASIGYILYIRLFFNWRRHIDYSLFKVQSENQNALIELIQGMPEIKLQRSERKRRWHWANVQVKLFRVNVAALSLTQYQDLGAGIITQLKDIFITILAAKAVIQGQMTLGMMLAVQYIIGQLNAPLQQLANFMRMAQDAKISLERMGEIHALEDEEPKEISRLSALPDNRDILIEDLSFKYNKFGNWVLKNINLTIPEGKVTAIVGTSGSGKTTLVKLMLGFYTPNEGAIKIGGITLGNLSRGVWRDNCGAVLQDGYIFSDTIANNISESDDQVDKSKLLKAVQTANIQPFIESLPLGYNTTVGSHGKGLSQGQRQRLLIARAVYKNPTFLFFDEATNALDAENEKVIMHNMDLFFTGRTVVVVAHRLSTVKDADQIVVLNEGEIVEQGTHDSLISLKGHYYKLVSNQLDLGG